MDKKKILVGALAATILTVSAIPTIAAAQQSQGTGTQPPRSNRIQPSRAP